MHGPFGRRFARRYFRDQWEGWTPPWMRGEGEWGGPGPRGGFGPWGGPGPRGGFGPWGGPGPRGGFGPWGFGDSPQFQALRSEAAEVARLFAIALRSSFNDGEKQSQLRAFLDRSRKELSDLIYNSGPSSTGTDTGSGPDVGQA